MLYWVLILVYPMLYLQAWAVMLVFIFNCCLFIFQVIFIFIAVFLFLFLFISIFISISPFTFAFLFPSLFIFRIFLVLFLFSTYPSPVFLALFISFLLFPFLFLSLYLEASLSQRKPCALLFFAWCQLVNLIFLQLINCSGRSVHFE